MGKALDVERKESSAMGRLRTGTWGRGSGLGTGLGDRGAGGQGGWGQGWEGRAARPPSGVSCTMADLRDP